MFLGRTVRVGCAFFISTIVYALPSDHAPAWNMPHFSEDSAALYRAAASISPPADAQVLVLDDEESYVFDADGRSVDTRYVLYKILTQNGVDGWDNVQVPWEPWHEERPTVRARVITADNAVHSLDPKTITDASASQGDDGTVYSDRRLLRAPLPAIAPGSLIEVEETIRENAPIFDQGIVTRYYFGRSAPVQQTRLSIDAPSSVAIRYSSQLLPDVQPTRTESNGRVNLVFQRGPMAALDEADPDGPSDTPAYPQVVFSTGSSWQRVAESYGKIIDRQIASSDVRTVVAGLVKGKDSRDDKVTAILQYLDQQVRYTGVELGDASIVPRTPSETLKRRFGDCKDKATLLVAMLRAADIPSFVGLLDAGDRLDVPANLPGMGLFDHAIVYVTGSPDLWIDATDEYARVGELPAADQGRFALIARDGSNSLISTPVSLSQENLLLEEREFYLAENGPARVMEVSEPHGSIDSAFRATYEDLQNKDRKKDLTDYMKSQYLAESTDRMERSDPEDITKQFKLTLESDKSKRGATDLETGVVAIRLDTLFGRLPNELLERESEGDQKSPEVKGKSIKTRSVDYQLPEAFVTEWDYKITPPLGFQPKPLPENTKLSLGPAVLTEDFSVDKDGVVHAVIRFDTVKRRFTVAEATEMRNRIADLREGQAIFIFFEPIARSLLAQGKVRESFHEYHDLIVTHPTEAVHHLQFAKALLEAGMGQAARNEARLAVRLESKSALAEETLAQILEYDLVGRKFRPGSDYTGAEAAFRAAEKLDPDDDTIVGNLAILLEFNNIGLRYGPGAKLSEALAEYRRLTPQQLSDMGLQNNLPITLFYSGEFSEALKAAATLNPQPVPLIVACEAAINGSQAGLAEAKRRTADDEHFKEVLRTAGNMLVNLRRYPLAADLLEAGASGENASSTVIDAAMYRNAQMHEKMAFPDNPIGVALHFFSLESNLHLTLDQLRSISSRNGQIYVATPEVLDTFVKRETDTYEEKARSGQFGDVGVDIAFTNAQPKVQGNDTTGYKVTLWPSTGYQEGVYVVKEDGKYKVLGTSVEGFAIGQEVLDRVAANDLVGARALLDWLRDDWHLAGGDDPLSGDAFPRIWTKGRDADAASMKVAAAAILAHSKQTASRGLAILEVARDSAGSEIANLNVSLALLDGYNNLEQYDKALAVCGELAKQYQESLRLFTNQFFDLQALGRFQEADALAQDRLKRIPDDIQAQRAFFSNAEAQSNYALAHDLLLKIVSSANAQSSDFNNLAWNSLFTGKTDQDDLAYAIKAVRLSGTSSSDLHTLGCIYTLLGKTKEAREVLIQGMDKLNLDEPDSNYWYAFGRIAEESGLDDIAAADYARVTKPVTPLGIPFSAYRLAQERLKVIGNPPKANNSLL